MVLGVTVGLSEDAYGHTSLLKPSYWPFYVFLQQVTYQKLHKSNYIAVLL